MTLGRITRLFAVGALLSGLLVACVVESDRYGQGGGGSTGTPPPSTTSPAPTATGNGAPSANPVLVDVDTGRTMTAQPGEGVGVFTEYMTGGHWHVWWTCDTNKTGASCAMDVVVTVASGKITNPVADAASAGGLSASSQKIEATTTTTTTTDGIRFDTDPGAIITLDGSIGSVHDGSFLFFVQGGKVNGGYTGTLTDPLMLEGSTP